MFIRFVLFPYVCIQDNVRYVWSISLILVFVYKQLTIEVTELISITLGT